jgi:phosphatidylglycerol:prolipoprotein diacylglycerol transferase
MFPIINIGPLAIQAYGFILISSFFIGLWVTGFFAKNIGTNGEVIENSLLFGLLSGILAARLGFLLQNPSIFSDNPLALLSLTPSMLNTSFGSFVGLTTAIIYAQKKHLPIWPTLDTLSPLVVLLFAGIHLANFANGELFGLPTTLPWGIELWNEIRHPVQAYAFVLSIITLVVLTIYTKLFRKTGFVRSGILFNLTSFTIGLILIFTRAFIAQKTLLGNMDLWQILGLIVVILSATIIYRKQYHPRKHIPVFLSLGLNQNPIENLSGGIEKLQTEFKLRQRSSIYLTKDIRSGKTSPKFYNQVAEIVVDIPYSELRSRLKALEKAFGRQTGNKNEVPLDLDILTYNGDVFHYDSKQVPDPNLIKYSYIAVPLSEIAPDFRHPASGKSIEEILENLDDKEKIQKVNEVEDGLGK